MTQSRSSRGAISFVEAAVDGSYITIENNTSGANAKSQDLKSWTLKRSVSGRPDVAYTFGEYILHPGQKLRIYASGNPPTKGQKIPCDFIINEGAFSWGGGTGMTVLLDERKTEKASLKSVISGLK